jgi:hypothetical protein
MDDQSIQFVNVAWDGINAPLQVSVNNGPFNVDNPRHVVTRCITENNNSHQQYRSGVRVTGTIDGTDVTTIPYFAPMSPFIAKSNLKIHFTTHGNC